MLKQKENYLSNLIHYLNEFESIFNSLSEQFEDEANYFSKVTHPDTSATDSLHVANLNRISEKFKYISMYINVSKDFYNDKQEK